MKVWLGRGWLRPSFCVAVWIVVSLAPGVAWSQLVGPLANPIRQRITKSGLTAEIIDWAQLPNTRNTIGGKPDRVNTTTRINFLRQAPDGRFFVNDLRGQFYRLDQNRQPQIYLDLDEEGNSLFPSMNFHTGLAAGFTTFQFHPEFASNGIFYTIHSERPHARSPAATFIVPDHAETGKAVTFHKVITEWTASDPAAETFDGSRREVARFGLTANNYFHPFGDMSFHPHAEPGDPDYGMLYITGGDWGFINGTSPDQVGVDGRPAQLQRLDTLAGTAIRIDPRSPTQTGGPAGHGDYTIPTDNPFFDDANDDGNDDTPNTFAEIWAYGFRNGHRLAWTEDGQLLVSNIGQGNIESTMFVRPGDNHGWPRREGTFVNGVNDFYAHPGDIDFGTNGDSDSVFRLPTDIANGTIDDGFEYPILQFDHGEALANAGGFVYHGNGVPQLKGKFIFGGIVDGRVFYAEYEDMLAADDGVPQTTAQIFELQLIKDNVPVDLDDLVPGRVDLRLAMDNAGELYLLTKGDGFIRKLVSTLGDFSGDGIVNAADYSLWRDHLGATSDAVLNHKGDGVDGVTAADYEVWKGHFGGSSLPASGASVEPVPEPASAIVSLTVATVLCVVSARKRLRQSSEFSAVFDRKGRLPRNSQSER